MAMQTTFNPARLRVSLRRDDAATLQQRRLSIGLSLVGLASMTATSLLQTGLLEHLPDPPLPGFDSDQVNLSKDAFPFGVPDGTIALAGFALNIPLAALGGPDRAERMPWLPLIATAKTVVDTAISGWYFFQMPRREKAWCIYCIVATLVNVGLLALALPEARRARRRLSS
jgi:uncharacterized membrane protein